LADGARPATASSHWVHNDGVDLHYLDTGDDDPGRAPVLFVPGLTDAADDYADVLATFGRRVVVVDLRGRGRSSSPASGYALDDHVSDLDAITGAAAIDRFHLATFSRGTAYGLAFAFRRAGQVQTITIGDYHAREMGIADGRWPAGFLDGRWRGAPVSQRISTVALEGIAQESVERSFWDELAALGVPVRVVRSGIGRDGHEFVDAVAQQRYRDTLDDFEIVTFEDSKHDLFRTDPHRYPTLVAELADRHDRGRVRRPA
jgi:pimeloyl-ACP methyl ester carboxylesterase